MPKLNELVSSLNIIEIEKILSSLANEDAIKIFLAAKDGIEKSTTAIKELGLTQKRYYTRLKELMEAGLIEKRDNAYRHTSIGVVCYALGKSFKEALDQRDRLDLVDRLRRSRSISRDEIKQIMQAISSNGLKNTLGLLESIDSVKVLDNYEVFISELIDWIDEAKDEVYMASYLPDPRVVEGVLRAYRRGVRISLMSRSSEGGTEGLEVLRMLLNPGLAKLYSILLDEKIGVRQSDFPYGFCVVDRESIILELPDPSNDAFYIGFTIKNAELGRKLTKAFKALYEYGREHPLLNRLKIYRNGEIAL